MDNAGNVGQQAPAYTGGGAPAAATMNSDVAHPVSKDNDANLPSGFKAGMYTGCIECGLCSLVRPSHEVDPQQIPDPMQQQKFEKRALEGRACACISCLPTFLCTIM